MQNEVRSSHSSTKPPAQEEVRTPTVHDGKATAATACRRGRPMTTISKSDVTAVFNLPQPEAAFVFGISLSALKRVCRRVGIKRWPYQRNYVRRRGRAKCAETRFNPLSAQDANERKRHASLEENDITAPVAILHVDGDVPSNQGSRCSGPDNNETIWLPCAESLAASSNNFNEAGTFSQGMDIFDVIDAVYSRSNDDCNHGSEYLEQIDRDAAAGFEFSTPPQLPLLVNLGLSSLYSVGIHHPT